MKKRFKGTVLGGHKNLAVEVPFDPAESWSIPPQKLWKGRNGHRVRATVNGVKSESAIVPRSRRFWLLLDESAEVAPGDEVTVLVEPLTPALGAPKKHSSEPDFGRVRELCLSLPDVEEKMSHGEAAFFVRKRLFVMFATNHHDDSRHALWCNAPEGAQQALLAADPENFFVPPYVGRGGWAGVRIDRGLGWNMIRSVVMDAHATSLHAAASKRRSTSRRRQI